MAGLRTAMHRLEPPGPDVDGALLGCGYRPVSEWRLAEDRPGVVWLTDVEATS